MRRDIFKPSKTKGSKDIMDNFVKWLDDGAFTPYGYAYDIGRGTINAIHRYKRYHKPLKAGNIDERSNGNGSLMRIMPAVLYCIQHHLSDSEAIDIIHKVGSLTTSGPISPVDFTTS